MTDSSAIKILLFDMGGIFLRLRDPSENFRLTTTLERFNRDWLMSTAVRDYERGVIDTEEFAERAVSDLNFAYTAEEFIRRFDRWPHEIYPGAIELLRGIPPRFERAILSNTNALHWGRSDIGQLIHPEVDRAFLSFETGMIKPDEDAYRQVVNHYDCAPDEVLFLDDNRINTEAAEQFGMQSRLCLGIDNVRTTLTEAGVF